MLLHASKMLLAILSIAILHYGSMQNFSSLTTIEILALRNLVIGMPLILSSNDAHVAKESNVVAENSNIVTYSDKINTSILEIYPIVIPPNWILQICLKDTILLAKLHAYITDCNDYPCMFSKIIEDESMKSVASIIRNDTMGSSKSQEFKQGIQDCLIWWKLFKHFEKNANWHRELGKCLFQSFSIKCKDSVLDKIKLFLTTEEEQ